MKDEILSARNGINNKKNQGPLGLVTPVFSACNPSVIANSLSHYLKTNSCFGMANGQHRFKEASINRDILLLC